MPFGPNEVAPVTIPEAAFTLNKTLEVLAYGTNNDGLWSVSLADPSFTLGVYGRIRIDPSMSQSQVVSIVRQWVEAGCADLGLTIVGVEDQSAIYDTPEYPDPMVQVVFRIECS